MAVACLALSLSVIPAGHSAAAPLPAAPPIAARPPPPPARAPPAIAARSYVLMDFNGARILAENKAHVRMEPASLTKLMTAYIVFKELEKGSIKLDGEVLISENAWRATGSRMFIEVNKRVLVKNLLQGMIIQSGNDATVALAEHVAGGEDAFPARV